MVLAVARVATPPKVRTFLLQRFDSFIDRVVDKPQLVHLATSHAPKIQLFMENPEKYLRLLRKER